MPISAEVLANVKAERIRRVSDLANRRTRERVGRFLIEGPQSVREVVAWRPEVVRDLYVEASGSEPDAPIAGPVIATIASRALAAGIYVHKVTRDVMAKISADAQGIVAVGDIDAMVQTMRFDNAQTNDTSSKPNADDHDANDVAGRIAGDTGDTTVTDCANVAAFWQVRDPGNAGTVIRAADAAGCAAVIFVDDCVDVFNPKVIRSTAGSLFHLPVIAMRTDEFFDWASEHHMRIIAADVYGTEMHTPDSLPDVLAERVGRAYASNGEAILFGNEARGLPEAILDNSDRIVSIPIYGKAESLNLATSAAVMLMSLAMTRQ